MAMKKMIAWAAVGVGVSLLLALLDQGENLRAHVVANLKDPLRWGWLALSLLAVAGAQIWNGWFRKIPLADFGIERVQRVLRFADPDYRETIWKRGWMTSHEWTVLNKVQIAQINAELKRRGLE
jgi:hypothetical protein